jgi:hypothetical protein
MDIMNRKLRNALIIWLEIGLFGLVLAIPISIAILTQTQRLRFPCVIDYLFRDGQRFAIFAVEV